MLVAVRSHTLPDQIFGQLIREIFSGGYGPGSTLPSERALSELFGVNRHAVREALKRLEQVGLVRIAHGGSTQILDFRRSAGLDALALIAEHADAVEDLSSMLPLLQSALEMRVGIGMDVARLCAERAGPGDRATITAAAEDLAAAEGPAVLALDERFWQCVVDGAGNLAYQLAFNSLMRGVRALPALSLGWLERELQLSDHRRTIAAAIAAGDPEAAVQATREALAPTAKLVTSRLAKPTANAGRTT
jgi:GntR family transcriptional repressor for pyruvate dehydrogenase complex